MPFSRVLVLLFIASFAISGMVEGYFGLHGESAVAFTHVLAIAVICFAWCRADIAERDIAAPTGSAIFCAVLPPLGVPVHFFRTRRVGPALVATAIAFAVMLASVLAYSLMLGAGEYLRSR